jgi:hypothetical protein
VPTTAPTTAPTAAPTTAPLVQISSGISGVGVVTTGTSGTFSANFSSPVDSASFSASGAGYISSQGGYGTSWYCTVTGGSTAGSISVSVSGSKAGAEVSGSSTGCTNVGPVSY